jgi:hypothetical protein
MTVTEVDLMKITRPAIMARIDMIIATITGSVNMINTADTTGGTIARFPTATAHTTAIIIGTAKVTGSLDPSNRNPVFRARLSG